jgi:hypothetical protein
VIIDPISAGLGIVSGGLGIFQGIASAQAQQQDYVNQAAYANAQAAYAKWAASMSARMQDASNSFQFWQQTVSYNQDLAYVHSLRNFELAKSIEQAKVVADTRTAAGANYIQQSEALNQQIQEKAMGDAVALQQYRMQVLRSSSAVQAMAQEGRGVDRLINDYARQEGDFSTLQQINQGLATRQIQREKVAAVTQYLQNYSSQQFYTEQQYLDPTAPFPPLPTLIQPPPPSMQGGRPANYTGLNIATGILGGVNTYFSSAANLSKYRGGTVAPPTLSNRTGLAFSGINLMG